MRLMEIYNELDGMTKERVERPEEHPIARTDTLLNAVGEVVARAIEDGFLGGDAQYAGVVCYMVDAGCAQMAFSCGPGVCFVEIDEDIVKKDIAGILSHFEDVVAPIAEILLEHRVEHVYVEGKDEPDKH